MNVFKLYLTIIYEQNLYEYLLIYDIISIQVIYSVKAHNIAFEENIQVIRNSVWRQILKTKVWWVDKTQRPKLAIAKKM